VTGTVTATVVFTDLVGSTELASRLGPVEAESLRQDHFSSLREAIVGAGGTEVKNLGDGLMAVFPSLGAGVDAAVAMQQAVDRHNRDHTVGTDIAIRVGMSTGDAVEEDGDYFGEPVVEAARLCARAGPGQILATDLVRVLCRRGPHEFEAMGDLELKGLPEPVTTWAVCWTPAALEPEVPLPARLGVADDVVVGRQEELAVLDGCLKDAAAGGRRVVLLAGEPGMGKTTLAATFACAAHEQGAAVLYGRCDEDLGVPYQPFLEAFGGFVDAAPEAVLQAQVDAYGGELQRLAPSLARRLPDVPPAQPTDPETERYLLFGAAVGLLSTIATRSPVVLVLDDLHWADKPTLLLVRHVVAAPALHGAVVVATYRDSDLSSDHPLVDVLAALRREPAVERVSLRGLGDDEVVELLEALAGHEMGEEGVALAHALVRETSGNPFFTREIVIHLAETGAIQQDESGRWVPAPGFEPSDLPESVREVVGRRIARLGDDTRRILGAAAVIGRDFDLALLAGVVGTDEDEVLDILDRAVTAGLVREAAGPADRFTFTHALVQHTLHNDLGATRRRRLHRKVAEVLEAVCGDDPGERVGELAAHWLAATAPVETTKGPSWRPTKRCAGSRPRSICSKPRRRPTTRSAAGCWSRWGWPNARRATPPSAGPSSTPPARRSTSGIRSGWWTPPWPTTAASSAPSARSTRSGSPSSSRRWRPLAPATAPSGRCCWPPSPPSSPTPATSPGARPWWRKPSPWRVGWRIPPRWCGC
jgi:class 3 adenylate cyclase/energy-coupling factor transporter ATP-binding protein EcfA2